MVKHRQRGLPAYMSQQMLSCHIFLVCHGAGYMLSALATVYQCCQALELYVDILGICMPGRVREACTKGH